MERKQLMKITKKNLWKGNNFQHKTYTQIKNAMHRATNPTKTPSGNTKTFKKLQNHGNRLPKQTLQQANFGNCRKTKLRKRHLWATTNQ